MTTQHNKYLEPAREIDVVHRTGVLVVGSGPGGLAAALAAARTGVPVTLVERFGCFGGNLTVVGVEGFAWYRHEQTVEANGIGREFEERAKAMGAAVPESQSLSYEIDSEGFKLVADRLVQEAGIHPMLHRLFVAPIMNGDTIAGIIVESKAGREAIFAERVIDATGDADIAHRAGAPTFKTPVEHMQAASVMFHLAGVDKQAFMAGVRADPQTYRDWATGELTYMNLVHLAGCHGTNPDSLPRFEIEGRQQAMLAIEALRRYTPGCTGVRLRNFGMTIGIRDTRKIDAVYNMTEQDVRHQARFDDSVGIYPEFIDGYGILILSTTGRYMHVPYRAMLPKGVKHRLVCGRAVHQGRLRCGPGGHAPAAGRAGAPGRALPVKGRRWRMR